MGDRGEPVILGILMIVGAAVLVPVLASVFFANFRAQSEGKKILAGLAALILIPCLLLVGVGPYQSAKLAFLKYLDSKKSYEQRQQVTEHRGITYRLPPANITGSRIEPDQTFFLSGRSVSFSEKNGVLVIDNGQTLTVKSGDVVNFDANGWATIVEPPKSR